MKTRIAIFLPIILLIGSLIAVFYMQSNQEYYHASGIIQSIEENKNGSLTLTLRSTPDFSPNQTGELGEPYEVILPWHMKWRANLRVGQWILYNSKEKNGARVITKFSK